MAGEIPQVPPPPEVPPEGKGASQISITYLIFSSVLILLALSYIIIIVLTYTYVNCSKITPKACEIHTCSFSLSGFHLVSNTKDGCCGNYICEIGEVYPECTDCPYCGDENTCTSDSYDYNEQRCVNKPILNVVCCGNTLCEEGHETNSSCQKDCPNCDDKSKFTTDSFNYKTQKCENVVTYYFIEDFEENKTSIDKGKNWKIIDDQGDKVLDCPGKIINGVENDWGNFGDRDWVNYTSELNFKLVENNEGFGFHFYSTGDESYVVDIREGIISLKKRSQQVREEVSSKPFDLTLDEWYKLKTEKTGNNIRVYINNATVLEYADSKPLTMGKLSIETFGNGHVRLNNISIKK